jgi:hypothetical protein
MRRTPRRHSSERFRNGAGSRVGVFVQTLARATRVDRRRGAPGGMRLNRPVAATLFPIGLAALGTRPDDTYDGRVR